MSVDVITAGDIAEYCAEFVHALTNKGLCTSCPLCKMTFIDEYGRDRNISDLNSDYQHLKEHVRNHEFVLDMARNAMIENQEVLEQIRSVQWNHKSRFSQEERRKTQQCIFTALFQYLSKRILQEEECDAKTI